MKKEKNAMRAKDAKRLPLDQILAKLGHRPVRSAKGGKEHWYISPFRAEKEPSMHISQVHHPWLGPIWVWKDFGDSGGSVIDFAIRYYNLQAGDISEALKKLDGFGFTGVLTPSPADPISTLPATKARAKNAAHPFTDVQIEPLANPRLIAYLAGRGIDAALARRYLREVSYKFEGQSFSALAFANDNGGYEIRGTGRFKSVLPPKMITILHPEKAASSAAVTVFEGFMDYLSALTHYGKTEAETPVIILNSASMQEWALEAIKEQGAKKVHLYLDRDATGQKLAHAFSEALPGIEIIDQSFLYAGYKDFNAFLMVTQQNTHTDAPSSLKPMGNNVMGM